jgi:hypothetical protein
MIAKPFPTLTKLWHGMCLRTLLTKKADVGRLGGLTVATFDHLVAADSMQFDLDLGRDVWLTQQRFHQLMGAYLPPADSVQQFLERCVDLEQRAGRRGAVTQLTCRVHGMRHKNYRWGNCMIGWTYRGSVSLRNPPVIALHSRTSNVARIGALDLGLTWVLAKTIADQAGIAVEDIGFRWFVDSLQWHAREGAPWCWSSDGRFKVPVLDIIRDEERWDGQLYPGVKRSRSIFTRLETAYERGQTGENWDEGKAGGWDSAIGPWGPMQRLSKRYEMWRAGETMPSVPISSLQLSLKEE